MHGPATILINQGNETTNDQQADRSYQADHWSEALWPQDKEGQEETSTHPLLTVPHHLLPSPPLLLLFSGEPGTPTPFGVGIWDAAIPRSRSTL